MIGRDEQVRRVPGRLMVVVALLLLSTIIAIAAALWHWKKATDLGVRVADLEKALAAARYAQRRSEGRIKDLERETEPDKVRVLEMRKQLDLLQRSIDEIGRIVEKAHPPSKKPDRSESRDAGPIPSRSS